MDGLAVEHYSKGILVMSRQCKTESRFLYVEGVFYMSKVFLDTSQNMGSLYLFYCFDRSC